jgi:hypothetical protein
VQDGGKKKEGKKALAGEGRARMGQQRERLQEEKKKVCLNIELEAAAV